MLTTAEKLSRLESAGARLSSVVGRPQPEPRRPWWWWLALALYLGIAAVELWAVYRIAAGHPVLGGLNFAG